MDSLAMGSIVQVLHQLGQILRATTLCVNSELSVSIFRQMNSFPSHYVQSLQRSHVIAPEHYLGCSVMSQHFKCFHGRPITVRAIRANNACQTCQSGMWP